MIDEATLKSLAAAFHDLDSMEPVGDAWFAWRPVRLEPGRWAWMRRVTRHERLFIVLPDQRVRRMRWYS